MTEIWDAVQCGFKFKTLKSEADWSMVNVFKPLRGPNEFQRKIWPQEVEIMQKGDTSQKTYLILTPKELGEWH